jgi:hypothetical protein
MGLDEYLKGKPNVTRQEVQDYIAGNRVDVQERQLGGVLSPEMQTTRDALHNNYRGLVDNIADAKSQFEEGKISYAQLRNTVSNNQIQIQALDTQINEINKTIPSTKYQQYQLPGGDNYREILLTLPNKPMDVGLAAENYYTQFLKRGGEPDWAQLNPVKQQEIVNSMPAQARNASASPVYTSSHFNEPNILAHMRVNDRIDADGKKMLLIEEVQSDWHQAGREKGYKTKARKVTEEQKQEFKKLNAIDDGDRTGQMNERLDELESLIAGESQGVPDAPFKGTWHQLALKRALKYAADNGYDRVGLTTGRQQAERYNLAKQVDYIDYVREGPDKYRMAVVGKDGQGVNLPKDIFSEVELKSYLGNDVAKRIVNGEGQSGGGRMTLRGNDLQIGGEGMKKYYDEIYPAFLEKQGKKYNAKTGETEIKTGQRIQLFGVGKLKTGMEPVRYIDISPEMRGGVKKGQPLFTAAPIGGIGLGAGTQDNEMPDAVRQYMADPRYSDPFADTTR